MSKYQGAVIGIGGIGKWHAAMQKNTGRVDVVAFCDQNEEMRQWASDEYPHARFYTDHKQMLENEKLDLVSVVTPHNLHAPIAQDALNAGAHVITEKPMATTYEDARAMVETAKKNNKIVTVFHNRRLDGWFLAAREAIDKGLLGNLVELNTGIRYNPSAKVWRGWTEPSGGLSFDWGAHMVDYVLNLTDAKVNTVSGFRFPRPDAEPGRIEAHATIDVRFDNGALGHINVSGVSQAVPERFRLVGEEGTLIDHWSDEQKACTVHTRTNGYPAEVRVRYRDRHTQEVYDNLVAAMAGEAEPMVTGESAAQVVNVLCKAGESHEQGGMPLPLS
jgi:predicted dehydrogenase